MAGRLSPSSSSSFPSPPLRALILSLSLLLLLLPGSSSLFTISSSSSSPSANFSSAFPSLPTSFVNYDLSSYVTSSPLSPSPPASPSSPYYYSLSATLLSLSFSPNCVLTSPRAVTPDDIIITNLNDAIKGGGCKALHEIRAALEALGKVALHVVVSRKSLEELEENLGEWGQRITFIPKNLGEVVWEEAQDHVVVVLVTEDYSPFSIVDLSPGWIARLIISIIIYVLMLFFSVYSLVVFLLKNGFIVNARPLVFISASLVCVCRIISFAIDLGGRNDYTNLFDYVAYVFLCYCVNSVLYAWLSICENVFSSMKQEKVWRRIKLAVCTLVPSMVTISVLGFALPLGPLSMDYFYYDLLVTCFQMVTVPSLIACAVVMMVAAVKVFLLISEGDQAHSHSNLKRKISITCLVNSLIQLFIIVLLIAYGFIVDNAELQFTMDGIREIANFACTAVNLYCVSYQLSELVHTTTIDKSKDPTKSDKPDRKSIEELQVVQMNPLDDFLESVITEKSSH